MLEDYKIFGDVIVMDTTYKKNKYNLICALFVRINNHLKNTVFAWAFMRGETVESFVWLLNTFIKSMGEKCLETIFTDQDAAM